jgi:hypothetical protein
MLAFEENHRLASFSKRSRERHSGLASADNREVKSCHAEFLDDGRETSNQEHGSAGSFGRSGGCMPEAAEPTSGAAM